ncbi:LysE family transporter [Nocardioides convexus]|uniref:LysE/ArgO family amino acid transporter n=1 Tax=Nocardioides convexus TaxID=2712224 RepID=UPI0031011FEE
MDPGNAVAESRRLVVGRTIALTWLNPHVYLDTLLLGSIAAAHDGGAVAGRWWFGVGAALGSVLWFTSLGFGARVLAPLLARPRAWQVVEVAIAVTMVLVAAKARPRVSLRRDQRRAHRDAQAPGCAPS